MNKGLNEFGRIDVLVNNVGLKIVKPAIDLSEAEFDEVSTVNFRRRLLHRVWLPPA